MIQEIPDGCQPLPGFIAPLKTGGWLTKSGGVTMDWEDRGVWDTAEELHAFIDTLPDWNISS